MLETATSSKTISTYFLPLWFTRHLEEYDLVASARVTSSKWGAKLFVSGPPVEPVWQAKNQTDLGVQTVTKLKIRQRNTNDVIERSWKRMHEKWFGGIFYLVHKYIRTYIIIYTKVRPETELWNIWVFRFCKTNL